MPGYRTATPGDAQAIAQLHARSWRESYRGAFTDAFLDGDLPGERLGVWSERLGAENAGVSVMEVHGGAVVRSCRYSWERPERLAAS